MVILVHSTYYEATQEITEISPQLFGLRLTSSSRIQKCCSWVKMQFRSAVNQKTVHNNIFTACKAATK